jgi:virulence factor Mce-like protein
MQRYLKPLAILVGVLLVGGGIGLAARSGSGGSYTITAYFEKAIGLFPKSDVNILGVPVGKVRSVDPQGSKVKVVMEVADRYDVPADAFAQIVPISVIADRFVQLHPAYTGGPTLEDGDVLDTDRTQIPAELDDVFKQLKKLLEAIEPGEEGEPGALGALVVALNDALGDREEDLRGTVVNTAALTGALADAQDDLSDVLINLDDLFGTLAQRAGSIGSLNKNFALVVTALAESRDDLEGTLANLADMTGEVGRLLRDHRSRLGEDLRLAGNVLAKVLENRASVEESLSWLPVVGIGLANAYNAENKDVDVRDNQNRVNCKALDDLPPGPIKDALKDACTEQTGEPDTQGQEAAAGDAAPTPGPSDLDRAIDCREGIKKVTRQLKRLARVDLPASVLEEVIQPLRKKLRQLGRECKELGRAILKPGELLDDLDGGVGDIPVFDDAADDLGDLTGNAAGEIVTGAPAPSLFDGFGDWFGGFFSFLGWSS